MDPKQFDKNVVVKLEATQATTVNLDNITSNDGTLIINEDPSYGNQEFSTLLEDLNLDNVIVKANIPNTEASIKIKEVYVTTNNFIEQDEVAHPKPSTRKQDLDVAPQLILITREKLIAARNANISYTQSLFKMKERIMKELDEIRAQNKKYDEFMGRITKLKQTPKRVRRQIKRSAKVHGAPFFKDDNLFPAPCHPEALKRQDKHRVLSLNLPTNQVWKKHERTALRKCIHQNCIDIRRDAFEYKRNKLEDLLLKAKAEDESQTNLQRQIANIEQSIEDLINRPFESLVADVEKYHPLMKFDWESFAVQNIPKKTAGACKAMWEVYLHPSITKGDWTNEENEALCSIAETHNYQDWDSIAGELSASLSKRSGFQCFTNFQTNLADGVGRDKWLPEESEKLVQLVEKYQIGEYIPWCEILPHFPGRTKIQVYGHYQIAQPYILKGPFSSEEDRILLSAVQCYGTNIGKMPLSDLLPGRTVRQAKSRYVNTLQFLGRHVEKWTHENDLKLLNLVQEMGEKWGDIVTHFEKRTRQACRQRYQCLKKFQQNFPNCDIKDAPRKKRSTYRNSNVNRNPPLFNIEKYSHLNLNSTAVKKGRPCKVSSHADNLLKSYFTSAVVFNTRGGRKKTTFSNDDLDKMQNICYNLLSVFQHEIELPASIEEVDDLRTYARSERILLEYMIETAAEAKQSEAVSLNAQNQATTNYLKRNVSEDVLSQMNESQTKMIKTYSRKNKTAAKKISNTENLLPQIKKENNFEDVENLPTTFLKSRAQTSTDICLPSTSVSQVQSSVQGFNLAAYYKSQCKYIPPNVYNLKGIRTLLINKKTLQTSTKRLDTYLPDSPIFQDSTIGFKAENEHIMRFKNVFKSIFRWPGMLSYKYPGSASEQQSDSSNMEVSRETAEQIIDKVLHKNVNKTNNIEPVHERSNVKIVTKRKRRRSSSSGTD